MTEYFEEYKRDLKSLRDNEDKYISDKACFHLKILYGFKIKTLEDLYASSDNQQKYLVYSNIGKEIKKMKRYLENNH